ncbi:two-component system regulatory protein YycI [Metabacillus sp. RGM 3146]|uniref:two-component system regulatory protein YycI n=1 Tax=Metabacillus sp. RGM 3146 TaxID=3401092 RepID=UPI003B9A2E33
MDWSKTKTIFIIAFLVLDLFLLYQYIETRNSNKYDVLQASTIEDTLSANDIQLSQLPQEADKGSYITCNNRIFTAEDLKNKKLKDQHSSTIPVQNNGSQNPVQLSMEFNQPVPLPADNMQEKMQQFVNDNILFGDQYRFWKYDKENNQLIYFQDYKGKTIFQKNPSSGIGVLVFKINDENQIYAYQQSILVNIKEAEDSEDIIPAIKAVEALFKNNEFDLSHKNKVTKAELGYYTQYPFKDSQILAPAWHIVVNGNEDFFVTAIRGEVVKSDQK